eukprot:1810085-Rhodomonas_salina.1
MGGHGTDTEAQHRRTEAYAHTQRGTEWGTCRGTSGVVLNGERAGVPVCGGERGGARAHEKVHRGEHSGLRDAQGRGSRCERPGSRAERRSGMGAKRVCHARVNVGLAVISGTMSGLK